MYHQSVVNNLDSIKVERTFPYVSGLCTAALVNDFLDILFVLDIEKGILSEIQISLIRNRGISTIFMIEIKSVLDYLMFASPLVLT